MLQAVKLEPLAPAPASIVGSDWDDLSWYFRTGGTDVFAASTSGAQWERASLFSRSWRACERCGGDTAAGRAGLGFVPSKSRGRVPSAHEAELLRLLDLYVDELPPAADVVCSACGGRGILTTDHCHVDAGRALTARPTGSSVKSDMGGSVLLDDASVAKLGRVTALLAATHAAAPRAAQVLAGYFSPEWSYDSDQDERERQLAAAPKSRRIAIGKRRDGICGLFGVWPLTPAGKTLQKASPKLHPLAALANANAAQRARPERRRGALLAAAETQASELFEEACRVWNGCSRERRRAQSRAAVRLV